MPSIHPNCDVIIGDARDKELLKPLIESSDVIIPLACLGHPCAAATDIGYYG